MMQVYHFNPDIGKIEELSAHVFGVYIIVENIGLVFPDELERYNLFFSKQKAYEFAESYYDGIIKHLRSRITEMKQQLIHYEYYLKKIREAMKNED